MPKLPEFTSKPIKGDLEGWSLQRIANIENLKITQTEAVLEKRRESFKKRNYKEMARKRNLIMDKEKQQAGNVNKKVPVKVYKVLDYEFVKIEGKRKKVITSTEYVNTYDSIFAAANSLNTTPTIVQAIISPKYKPIAWKGYTFKYANND